MLLKDRRPHRSGPARLLAALLLAAAPAAAQQEPPVFVGETLRFSTSVFGITGGHLILAGREDTWNGRKMWRGEFQAVSSDLLSKFFLVRDWVATWMDPVSLRSVRFEKHTVEGKRVRDETITFDWEAGLARGERNGESFEVPISRDEPAFDSLSTIFYVRTLPLEVGAPPREIRVVNRKGVATLRIVVHGRETIKVPAGKFRTIRVEPTAADPDSEGLIGKGKNMILWLTDDARRMPVQIRSKLKTGTLVGRLVAVERGNQPPPPTPPAPTPTPLAVGTL
jgi:hypothetical protein